MKKLVSIKIPKGTECKNGVCEQDLELEQEIEIPEIKPTLEIKPTPEFSFQSESNTQVNQPIVEQKKEESREFTHDELSELMPKGVNFSKCADGSCHDKITNSKFTSKFKTCPECGSNTVPLSSDFCPTCGIDSQDNDFWDESEIELEENE